MGKILGNKGISINDISVILAEKSKEGKAYKIKKLLSKYNAEKLVDVKPEDYRALFEEAKEL